MIWSDREVASNIGPIDRASLIGEMVELLKAALDAQGDQHEIEPTTSTPLLGGEAVLASLALVTYVLDVESLLNDWGFEITLASEAALSRRESPFLTVQTLADYVIELSGSATSSESVARTRSIDGSGP